MIHFSDKNWSDVRVAYENWWNKKATQAVVGAAVDSYAPSGKVPSKPLLTQNNVHLGFTTDEVLDAIEYDLSRFEFFGDAFPMFNMDCFGPGVVAAFLGCEMQNNNGETSVWFTPKKPLDINDFDVSYDGDNPVFKRIKDIYKRGAERFEGRVLLGMADLGGVADVLSSFFPGDALMLEMYDNPEAVKCAVEKIDKLWQKFYDDFCVDMRADNYGYTDWSRILSTGKRSYIIQSDITFMLSNDMFKDFVLDSIKRHCENLDRTIYHLDGVGELKNLDDILAVAALDAVQWVPGTNSGRDSFVDWYEVYAKIVAADKLTQVPWAPFEQLERILRLTDKKGYFEQSTMFFGKADRDYAKNYIEKLKSL